MKFIKALAVGLIAAASSVACSSQHGAGTTGTNTNTTGPQVVGTYGTQGPVGKIAMAWQYAAGLNVYNLSYTLTPTAGPAIGPNTINIGDAMSAEWVAGGIPVGCYTLTVTGTDTANDPCTSGAIPNVCITAGQTTYEQLTVTCFQSTNAFDAANVQNGSLAIEAGVVAEAGSAFVCPGINSFSISPAELAGSVQTAQVVIATQGPNLSSVKWTASGCRDFTTMNVNAATPPAGFFLDPAETNPNSTSDQEYFSCGTCTGQVTVTATITSLQAEPNGTVVNACQNAPFTAFQGFINCEGGGAFQCFNPTPNLCGTNTCVNFQTDPANCGNCNVACSLTQTCTAGACTTKTCGAGQALCTTGANAGNCVPDQTDVNNCGACGNVCAAGDSCVAGVCQTKVCPAGQGLCADGVTCVPDQTDVNNCGACAHVCAAGDTCVAGVCTVPPPTPCTAAPCAAVGSNSVQCTGSLNNQCTATEAAIVNRDISKGNLAGGQLTAGSCYACLVNKSCIDDTGGDTGNECDDLTGTTNALDGEPAQLACLDVLTCAWSSGCDTANPPAFCFCGAGGAGSACLNAGAANGPCVQQEINGLLNNGTTVIGGSCTNVYPAALNCTEGNATNSNKAYKNQAIPSGMANSILGCAYTNCKAACTP